MCLPCAGFAFSRDLRVNLVRPFYPPPHSPPLFYYPPQALHSAAPSVCVCLYVFRETLSASRWSEVWTCSHGFRPRFSSFCKLRITNAEIWACLIALFNVLYFKLFSFFCLVFVCFRAKGQRGFANIQDPKYKALFSTLLQGYRDRNVSLTAVKLILPIMQEWKQCASAFLFFFRDIFVIIFALILHIFYAIKSMAPVKATVSPLVQREPFWQVHHNHDCCHVSTAGRSVSFSVHLVETGETETWAAQWVEWMWMTQILIRTPIAIPPDWPHGPDVTCKMTLTIE